MPVPVPVPLLVAGVVTVVPVVPEPVVSVGVLSPPRVQATVPISTADSISAERPHAKACRMGCMTFIV